MDAWQTLRLVRKFHLNFQDSKNSSFVTRGGLSLHSVQLLKGHVFVREFDGEVASHRVCGYFIF